MRSPMPPTGRRRLVLVVGAGRSGTSLLAGMLGRLGLHLPQPQVRADRTNPRGFGEPRWVVDFHSGLLRDHGVTLNDARPAAWERTREIAAAAAVRGDLRDWLERQLRESGDVLVKDPRTVWFLPLWLHCAAELGAQTSFVTMLRHPAAVVTSARRSYGTWLTAAARTAAWLNVMLEAERATRGRARAFVRYQDLLADWARELRRIGAALDIAPLAAVDRAGHPEIDALVDPSLHRSGAHWSELDVPVRLRDLAEDAWRRLQALAAEDAPAPRAALDEARAAYRELYAGAEAIAQSSIAAA